MFFADIIEAAHQKRHRALRLEARDERARALDHSRRPCKMRHITSWQRQAGSSTTWRVPASRFAMAQCQDRPGRRSVIHLDSSFLIDLLRETTRERPGGALEFIESLPDDEVLAISVHVLAELRAGAELAKQPLREHEELDRLCSGLVVSYPDDRFAPAYARLLAALQRTRRPMAAMDLLIATAATLDDAPLVTRNVKDFSRVPGLRVLRY